MEAELSALKSNLLESLFDEAALKPALTQFAQACNVPIVQLMVADGTVVDGRRSLLRSTFSTDIDDALAVTEHHYQHINPRVLALPKMRIGRATRDKDFISWEEMHKDQTYQELIVPAGLGHGSLVPVVHSASLIAGIALHRPIAADPFSDREAERHEYVSAICAGAFELADRISNRHAKNVLNMFGPHRAAAVFSRAGLLLEYNDAYEALCSRRSVLLQKGKHPEIVKSHAIRIWRKAIRKQTGTVQISRLDQDDPYLFCTILPMPLIGQHLYSSENVLALFHEELSPSEVDSNGLQKDFGLTPAETQTAILITCGCSAYEVSQRRSVSVETTRSLLKRALSKIGKRSQPELASLVCSYRLV